MYNEGDKIISINEFNANSLTFSRIREDKERGYKRIYINTKSTPGGSVLLETGPRFCFGIKVSVDMKTKELNGYQLVIPTWSQEGATEEELRFLEVLQEISDKCAQHLVAVKAKKNLVEASLTNILPLWKKDEEDEQSGPVLYLKLITKGYPPQKISIATLFNYEDGNNIEPLTLVDTMFKITKCVIHVQSIYIGSSIKIQMRATEVEVQQRKKLTVPLMLRPRPTIIEEVRDEKDQNDDDDKDEDEPINEGTEYVKPLQFEDYIQPTRAPSSSPVEQARPSIPELNEPEPLPVVTDEPTPTPKIKRVRPKKL